MTFKTPFTAQLPQLAATLPLTLISLDDWVLISVKGADSHKYLQGQVTADIDHLEKNQHVLSAHCDAKGKMWSNLRLFHYNDGYAFIERKSLAEIQLAELKKYAVFSKVTFTLETEFSLFGLAGKNAANALSSVIKQLPEENNNVSVDDDITVLHYPLPASRFLVIVPNTKAAELWQKLDNQFALQKNDSNQWLSLEIEAGYPVIDNATSNLLIPQATNLQALPDGICFKKGCYTGQEMVARAKFRGANKRAMYTLLGTGSQLPEISGDIEWQLGDKWRRTGTVLAAVRLNDERILVQVVMNNDMQADSVFRVRDDANSVLNIVPLPYSLVEDK